MRNRIMKVFNNRLMMVMGLSLIICHLSFSPVGAQTFTQRLQKTVKGEGTVTLYQEKAIEDLVNGPRQAESQSTAARSTAKSGSKGQADAHPGSRPDSARQDVRQQADTAGVKPSVRTYKVMGYRVQAFAGGNSRQDRQKAEQTGTQLRTLFPMEQVYTHFYSPRWICRIGNYRTYEEAHRMLEEVRKLGYGSATIVKVKISVPY